MDNMVTVAKFCRKFGVKINPEIGYTAEQAESLSRPIKMAANKVEALDIKSGLIADIRQNGLAENHWPDLNFLVDTRPPYVAAGTLYVRRIKQESVVSYLNALNPDIGVVSLVATLHMVEMENKVIATLLMEYLADHMRSIMRTYRRTRIDIFWYNKHAGLWSGNVASITNEEIAIMEAISGVAL